MKRALSCLFIGVALLAIGSGGCKNPSLSGAILHFDQGRYDRAREAAMEAVSQEPNNAEAHLVLGRAFAELDSTTRARRHIDRAIDLSAERQPDIQEQAHNALEHYWSLRHNEGLSYAQAAQESANRDSLDAAMQNYRAALDRFKRARVYEPDKEATPRNMGAVYFSLGEPDSGLAVLKEAQTLAEPGDSTAAQQLFNQYRRLGNDAASQQLEDGTIDPEGLRDAIRFYSAAEELQPRDTDLLFSLGVVHFQLANADEEHATEHMQDAVEYFDKTLQINPRDEEALYNAASLRLELEQCEKGLEQSQRLLDMNPRQGRYHGLQGRILDCLGDKDKRVAGLVFSQALRSGEVLEDVQELRQEYGVQSDIERKYREEGAPEEIRSFTDATGGRYVTWFYWTRGRAYAFHNGEEMYQTEFQPQQPEEGSGGDLE
ncbi:MAG: tetratricopeptide repeat protein [Candidatus Eisenbacteria bacterium]|nr:tetratricopeptide repeat protein [Candidatus Latescibacterota bacterium]MBD3301306.1 tetratricopeptide repeat protein [Candidatus Eisenbacteria bacterium]